MPASIAVELAPHSPDWKAAAEREAARLASVLGSDIVAIHHIGSTAIPGIHAKPILDLMPVVRNLAELDTAEPLIAVLGYRWWGEYGISGRRYCTLDDLATGRRIAQLHCFQLGSPEIEKHLAFRDYLRAHPAIAQEYETEKQRCRLLHPDNSHAYSDAKAPWIQSQLPRALAYYRTAF